MHNPTGPVQSPIRKRLIATRPAGLEPATFGFEVRDCKNITDDKRRTYEIGENHSAIYSAILLQKHLDLEQIISAWPELPEHIKAAIMALVQAYKDSQNKGGT